MAEDSCSKSELAEAAEAAETADLNDDRRLEMVVGAVDPPLLDPSSLTLCERSAGIVEEDI